MTTPPPTPPKNSSRGQLSRHENLFRSQTSGNLSSLPERPSRLSLGGQRLNQTFSPSLQRNPNGTPQASTPPPVPAENPTPTTTASPGTGRSLPQIPSQIKPPSGGTPRGTAKPRGGVSPAAAVQRTRSSPTVHPSEGRPLGAKAGLPSKPSPVAAPRGVNGRRGGPVRGAPRGGSGSGQPSTKTPPSSGARTPPGAKPSVPSRPATPTPTPAPATAAKPPPIPTKPELPPKPLVLNEQEHILLLDACKKLGNANKQLLAVSRASLEKLSPSLSKVTQEFLNAQLGIAAQDFHDFNNRFLQFIKEANKAFDHRKTCNIACLTVDLANFSSVVCAALKLAAVECDSDDSVFKQCLKAITTVKNALLGMVEGLTLVSEKVDASLVPQLEGHIKKTSTTLAGLVGHKCSGPLISVGVRMELEAAVRAAVVSIAKLVNSFNGPLDQSILTEAKVASCCVAQLWGVLNEMVNTGTNLLSMPEIREIIAQYAAEIKVSASSFMEKTKLQVTVPTEQAFAAMKENERPLRDLLRRIVAYMQAYAQIETSDREDIVVEQITPTEQHYARADALVAEPADIVPPPPKNATPQSSLDLPDDYVESTEYIWDEPTSDEGRVVCTENGLKSATLNKLIIHTTASLDMNRMKTFITTYRSFTTPEVLLDKLIQRYHVPESSGEEPLPIQLRCCNALKHLIETQYEDFSEQFLDQLNQFLDELNEAPAYKKFAVIIQSTLQKKQEERQTTKTEIINLTVEEKIPLLPSKLLFVINEEEIARQLTLVDFRIYQAIQPAELLNQAWNKAKYKHRAKNVLAMIARSTALTMWAVSVILWQDTLRARVRAYTKLINVAHHLYQLNNFNSLMALIAAFSSSAIHRLKFTREQVPDASQRILKEMIELMDSTQSYGNYRQRLHDVDPPCVPFLGTYLTQITFMEDGNPDYINGLINYRKREMVFGVIREIQQYQQQSYNDEIVNVAHFLTELASNDENALYDLSLLREPRNATLDQLQ